MIYIKFILLTLITVSTLHAVALLAEVGHPVVVTGQVVEGGGHEAGDGCPARLLLPEVIVAAEAVGGELVHIVLTYHRVPEVAHAPPHPGLALLAVGGLVPGTASVLYVHAEVGPGLSPDLGPNHPPEVGDHEGAELRILGLRAKGLYEARDLYLEVADGVCSEDGDCL